MDSVKNWYRSKSMNFNLPGTTDFKSQAYGPTDRALSKAADVCKRLAPSAETRSAVASTVKDVTGYGRRLVSPTEETKQKVTRFYESRVAKLKYAQLKDGFQPLGSGGEDRARICSDVDSDDDSFSYPARDQQVPGNVETLSVPMRLRTASLGAGPVKATQPVSLPAEWNGSFMQYKEPARRPF